MKNSLAAKSGRLTEMFIKMQKCFILHRIWAVLHIEFVFVLIVCSFLKFQALFFKNLQMRTLSVASGQKLFKVMSETLVIQMADANHDNKKGFIWEEYLKIT